MALTLLAAVRVLLANLGIVNFPLMVSSEELPSPTPSSTAEAQTQNDSLIVPALFWVFSMVGVVGVVKAVGLLVYLTLGIENADSTDGF